MKKIYRLIKDLKLRNKLYLIYLAAGLLPMLVVGLYCCYFINQLLVEREVKNLQNSLNQAMSVVDNQLTIYENISDYLAFNQAILQTVSYPYEDNYYEMYNQFSTVFDPMVTSLKYLHSDIKQVTIYARNDIERHDTTLAPITDIEQEAWFQEISNSNKILWVMDKSKEKIFCVRKMPELQGESGVIYIEVDYNKLFEPLTQMLDENYGVYVQKKDEMVFSYNIFQEPYDRMDFSEGNISSLKTSNDSEFIFVDCDLKGAAGLHAGLYRPASQIEETIAPMMKGMVIIYAVSVIAAGLLLTQLTKMIVRNIEKLTQNMKDVKRGNLEVTVTSDSQDEIGELIQGFGDMVERIKTLIEKVYEGKISLKEYEMKALQAQINPHFLYNSLSLINWKAIEADEKDISKITLALSKFYRTALNKGNNVMPLEDEISNVKSYLDIQLMMHDYEFDVEMDIDERMYYYDTPNLILQPLIENAIDHGIDLKTEGRGKIIIRGWSEGETMYLSVEDNGVGMEEEVAKNILTQKSKGYGVRNVNERIKLIYGQEYGLDIQSKVGKGTKITIKFPIVIRKGGLNL
ncbi:sensor histidine kinase [Roseburia sp. 499]|uniref:sensor histidine kinase n=1 Tax=Roseburia sp. 499 TaxID=1261634 RepID=UPI000952053E|nr:sensor histidine kinase [Roseburia sp. 499]WVK69809.1 sensor histidine kinase [Roseburia sp. 499]